MSGEPDRDLLAAEYVLGSLEGDDRREAERLLATVRHSLARSPPGQQRLTPLAAHVCAGSAAGRLWRRIEADIGSTGATVLPFRRRVRLWQTTTGVALAIAAALAAFIVLHQPDSRVSR